MYRKVWIGVSLIGMYFLIWLSACQLSNRSKPNIGNIDLSLKIQRFEKDLFTCDTIAYQVCFAALEEKYPHFYPLYINNLLSIRSPRDTGKLYEMNLRNFIANANLLKNVIKRTLKADAWCLMTLPSGQSFDVLRVKQTQINDQRFEAKFSFLGWQDITSLVPGGGFGTGIDTVVSYQFYNNQTKAVLCNMTTDSTFQRVVNITIKTTKPIVNSNQEVTILKTPIKVFPNPAASYINLELPDYQNHKYQKLTGWDALGRLVITQDLDKNIGIPSLNIGALSTGMYILEAHTSDGKVSRGSFQKL